MIQATTAQLCGCTLRPKQFRSVSAEPLAATRGTPVEKHCRRQTTNAIYTATLTMN